VRLAGYAAIFDAPDKGGDIVRKGAFARAAKAGLPLLWQHDQRRRIGFVESLSEDARGLRVIAQLDDDSAVVQAGSGLSFGYRVRAMQQQEYRELTDLDLIEVSIVATPMQPLARVLAVEASGPNSTDIRQFTQGE
jgi:HK97 family phage prohead protease